MPIYEYKCEKCHNVVEVLKGYNEPSPTKCPHCEGKLKRLYQPAGIIFKGSGFYKTDYCQNKPKEKSKEDTKGEKSEKTKESVA